MQHNIFRTYESIITEDHAEELDEALLSNLGVKMKIATTKDHTKLPGLLRLLKQKGEDQKGMDGWTKIASNRHKKLSGKEMETAPKPLPKTKEQSTPVQPKATEPTSTREAEKPRKRATPQNYSTHSKNEKDTVSSSPDGDDYTIRDKFTLNKYSSERLDEADAHLQKLRDGDKSHKDTEHNIRSIVFNALHRNIEPKHHEHIRHYVNGNHDKYNSQIKAALDKGSKTVSKAIGVILNMRDTGLESEPKNEGFNPAYLMQMSESRKRFYSK